MKRLYVQLDDCLASTAKTLAIKFNPFILCVCVYDVRFGHSQPVWSPVYMVCTMMHGPLCMVCVCVVKLEMNNIINEIKIGCLSNW